MIYKSPEIEMRGVLGFWGAVLLELFIVHLTHFRQLMIKSKLLGCAIVRMRYLGYSDE